MLYQNYLLSFVVVAVDATAVAAIVVVLVVVVVFVNINHLRCHRQTGEKCRIVKLISKPVDWLTFAKQPPDSECCGPSAQKCMHVCICVCSDHFISFVGAGGGESRIAQHSPLPPPANTKASLSLNTHSQSLSHQQSLLLKQSTVDSQSRSSVFIT